MSVFLLSQRGATDNVDADINNVGLITLALYAKANPVYDEIAVSTWQTAQVSILSISNCAGRILIGSILSSLYHILPDKHCRHDLGLHANLSPSPSCIQFVHRVFPVHNFPNGSNECIEHHRVVDGKRYGGSCLWQPPWGASLGCHRLVWSR